jgi:hypothetical protein
MTNHAHILLRRSEIGLSGNVSFGGREMLHPTRRESYVIYGQQFQPETEGVNPAAHTTIDHIIIDSFCFSPCMALN